MHLCIIWLVNGVGTVVRRSLSFSEKSKGVEVELENQVAKSMCSHDVCHVRSSWCMGGRFHLQTVGQQLHFWHPLVLEKAAFHCKQSQDLWSSLI